MYPFRDSLLDSQKGKLVLKNCCLWSSFMFFFLKKANTFLFPFPFRKVITDINTKTQSVQYKETLNKNSMWENGSEKVIPCKDFERGSLSSTSSVSEGPALEYKDNTSKVIPKLFFGSL